MTGYMVAIGPCWSCKIPFLFDPERVQAVLIDPETQRPPDLGGDPERARREPLCPHCCKQANQWRRGHGVELYDETDTGTVPPR